MAVIGCLRYSERSLL